MSWRRSPRGPFALVAVAGFLLLAAAPATATDRTVCSSGCDFTSIQAAVDAASPGDSVVVGPGTYVEQVSIDKRLHLTGYGPDTVLRSPASPVVRFASVAPVIAVAADDVKIDRLTVDGDGRGSAGETIAGIGYEDAAGVRVEEVTITGARTDPPGADPPGAGILAAGGDSAASIVNSDISGNDVGIAVEPGGSPGPPSLAVHLSRLAEDPVAISNTTGAALDAERNWFGCNGGPGADGCGAIENSGGGTVDADPWIVLAMRASAPEVEIGSEVGLFGGLRLDSAGDCLFPPNFKDACPEVSFPAVAGPRYDASLGAVVPGPFALWLSAGAQTGTSTVSASLDGETVSDQVEIVPRPLPPFRLDRIVRDRRHGTARLDLFAGESGTIALRGRGIRNRTIEAGNAGKVKVTARARGRAKALLRTRGRVRVDCSVTWTSRFGEEVKIERRIRLIQRR